MSNFTTGQQVKVVGNDKDVFLSRMVGEEIMTHAVPNGEIVTVISAEDGGVYVDTTEVKLLNEHANKDRQWLREEYVVAV